MFPRFVRFTLSIGAVVFAAASTTTAPAVAGNHTLISDPIVGYQAVRTTTGRVPQWGQSLARHQRSRGSAEWRQAIASVRGQRGGGLLSAVNATVNRARYVSDSQNWGRSDYWASPTELLTRGGDCEDFAIAKYIMLKELGIPASRMRILVLRAGGGQVEHSVLAVSTNQGVMILDNQRSGVYQINSGITRRTVYSVSGGSMWVSTGAPNLVAAR